MEDVSLAGLLGLVSFPYRLPARRKFRRGQGSPSKGPADLKALPPRTVRTLGRETSDVQEIIYRRPRKVGRQRRLCLRLRESLRPDGTDCLSFGRPAPDWALLPEVPFETLLKRSLK